MFYSIKAKVVTIYSVVMIAFTFLLLLTIFINERDDILDLELKNSTTISKMHAQILNQEFSKYVTMLKMLSENAQIKLNDKSVIASSLKRLMEVGDGNFTNAVYVDKNLTLTDVNGVQKKVNHPLFLKGDQWLNKDYNITVPLYTRFQKSPVIMVAVPILDTQNKWKGTLAVSVPITVITEKLSALKLPKESFAWLTDSNNLIVSHPDKRFVMKVSLPTTESKSFPGVYDITKQTQLQNEGYGRYFDVKNNEPKIVTFSKIDCLPGWNFFITTKESEVFKEIDTILINILVTSIILTVIFLLLISQLSNKITQPIIQLTKDVKMSFINKGAPLKVIDSKDEIGQLSQAFYDSAQEIYLHTTHLEKMVAERTLEISDKNELLGEKNNKLEELASKDPLTLLYNRRAFNPLVDKEISRSKRHQHKVTLIMLDIDNFKNINDLFGHTAGDNVLRRFAEELSNTVRKENIICRWGGEEFVILIPETTSDVVFNHIDHIRDNISKMDFSPVSRVTFSAGIATMLDDESFSEWLQRADDALYKAKASGRNRVICV